MYRQRRRKEAFIGKVGNVVKKGGKVVEDNTVGQVKKLSNVVQMIFRTIGAIPKKIAEFVKTIPKKTWEHIKRIFEPLFSKLKWLFDWFKTLCLCSFLLCLASSCFSLGLPQMMVSIVQGAGSVAALTTAAAPPGARGLAENRGGAPAQPAAELLGAGAVPVVREVRGDAPPQRVRRAASPRHVAQRWHLVPS